MVNKHTGKRLLSLLMVLVLIMSGACGSSGQDRSREGAGKESRGGSASASGADTERDEPGQKMNGPDVPPEGMAYDEWKGIRYTTDTVLDVTSYFALVMRDGSLPKDNGYDDEGGKTFGRIEIVDVKAEPVGGEMKLRSGGYVDVTVKLIWSGYYSFHHDDSLPFRLESSLFETEELVPFDLYTGTALFNYSEGEDGRATSVGEATDSGYVESVVTWKGKTSRLFAKQDHRNSGRGNSLDHETRDGVTYYTWHAGTETVYSFRLPADYDGLALCIMKDSSEFRPYNLSDRGEILAYRDLYADVLTDNQGVRHGTDEFYFIRLSDLVEQFA